MLYMSTFAKKVTSAVLTSAIVLTTAGSTAGVNAALMNQIDAANTLANQNVIVDQSTNPSAYRLADTIQRKEALKVMMKLSDKTVSQGACTSPFADIKDTDWACKYAVAALNAGFIAKNATFRPDDNVSKIEALKMVMKARGIEKDTTASDWRAGYVNAAVNAKIAESFSDYNTAATRWTMFVWAAEAIKAAEKTAKSDEDNGLSDITKIIDNMADDTSKEDTSKEDTKKEETKKEDTTATVDQLVVSLDPESPADGLAPADTNRVALLKFDVTAGSEDVTLNEATLDFIGLGDYKKLDNVAIYNEAGEKVSKTKDFSEVERKISFDKNVVVEAGTTMTLTVAGELATNGSDNATYGVKLVDLKASSNVVGEDLVGALLVPATFANAAELKVNADKQSGKVTIGDTETFAKFDVEEKIKDKNAILKTITLDYTGTANRDDISNIEVYIEGKKIDTKAKINEDDELIIPLDYKIEAKKTITVEVKGSVTGSVGDNINFAFDSSNDGIYALGEDTQMPVKLQTNLSTEVLSDARKIEGSEINVSFKKTDKDEYTPDSQDDTAGTLKLLALTDAYEIKDLSVTVTATGTTKNIKDIIENVELGGVSYDSSKNEDSQVATFTFKDISLKANEEQNLPLTFDVLDDNTLNGANIKFQVAINRVYDDVENKNYTSTSNPALSSILSSTALDNKDIDIKTGHISIDNVQVNNRDLVIGNGVETVLYKAKINTGDAEDVSVSDLKLVKAANNSLHDANGNTNPGEDLDKVIDTATLNIGGKTFKADIDNDSVDFTSIDAVIPADSNGVEVLVTAVLKDNDNIKDGDILALKLDDSSVKVDDSKWDTLPTSSVDLSDANNKPTQTALLEQGTFEFAIINNGNYKNDIDSVVLAGENDVALAEYKMEADLEDMDVKKLRVKIPVNVTTPANPAIEANVAGTKGNKAIPLDYGYGVTKVELTTSAELETGDKVYVTVNNTTFTKEVTSSAANALDSLGTDIKNGNVDVVNYTVNGNTLTLETADDASKTINITYPAINSNGTAKTLSYKTVQAPAHQANETVTLSRTVKAGDSVSVTVNGRTYSYISANDNDLEILAAKIDADADVASATETTDGKVITITGKTDGTPVELTASATPKAAVVSGDVSDTLSNVRLMDGSNVIASTDDIKLVGDNTVITFNDFNVVDGDSIIDWTIVANITKYTTTWDETSATLGDITISTFNPSTDAEVEGISSDNDITAAVIGTADGHPITQGTLTVSVVPEIMLASVKSGDTFSDGDSSAVVTLDLDKGNNNLDGADTTIETMKFIENADKIKEIINLDNNDEVLYSSTVGSRNGQEITFAWDKIVHTWDRIEIRIDDSGMADNDTVLLEIAKDTDHGITYKVGDKGPFDYNVDSRVSLGTFKK